MKIAAGVLLAPRPLGPVYQECIDSLKSSLNCTVRVFAEPNSPKTFATYRPDHYAPPWGMTSGPNGELGNFQNWIQSARDMLVLEPDADAILIAEDDAIFTPNILSVIERDLWPCPNTGCVTLYCPHMSQYNNRVNGLTQTTIRVPRHDALKKTGNLVGALALLFPRQSLEELVVHPSIAKWGGSHGQKDDPNTKRWELKAVDTWIGRTLAAMGKTIWHYTPSLVGHNEVHPKLSNSSLGHQQSQTRKARGWVGRRPVDLLRMMNPRRNRYDIVADLREGAFGIRNLGHEPIPLRPDGQYSEPVAP